MIFNSFTYLLFLPTVVVLYWRLPLRTRWALLYAASLLFYGFWRLEYVALLVTTITIDYVCARRIGAAADGHVRWRWLALSISINLGMLLYFKYTMFVLGTFNGLGAMLGYGHLLPTWSILLPIGVSFYVFQQMAYIVDVYRGHFKPVDDYLLYSAFVTFFPQLVAGPILRASELVPQFERHAPARPEDIAKGCWLIANGLFLKCALADNIAPFVDSGFTVAPVTLSALDVWVLACLFGFQIYFDFSAYSMIAQGSARLMGIALPDNFNFPYFASSPRDFWRRWHISLSSWIRDYLYLPLCGVRPRGVSTGGLEPVEASIGSRRRTAALVGTWAIMGLWHGANWTFLLWGLWHAALIIAHRTLAAIRSPLLASRAVCLLGSLVGLALVMLSWVLFRAQSVESALVMLAKTVSPREYLALERLGTGSLWSVLPINIDPLTYLAVLYCAAGMIAVYWAQRVLVPLIERQETLRIASTIAYGAAVSAAVLIYLRPARQFIYFQF